MANILVTGGTGFTGIALVERLVRDGHCPRVIDLNPPDYPEIENSIEFIRGDTRDIQQLKEAYKGIDTVFHLAATVLPTRGKWKYMSTNFDGTRNVAQAALENKVKHMVHISTSAVFGVPKYLPVTEETGFSPMGYYGTAKYLAETELYRCREQGLKVAILRPRTIIGTQRLGIFHILFDWIKSGKNVPIIGSGDNLFQFISVNDVVEACILASSSQSNHDYNIGAEEFSTVRSDLEALVAHASSGSRVVSIPSVLVKSSLQVLDLLRLSPLMDWQYKVADKPFYFDISKAKRELGWHPKDSNIGMFISSYDWYVNNFDEHSAIYGSTHRQAVKQKALRLVRKLF